MVAEVLNSPLMVLIPGLAGVGLLLFSKPVDTSKLGGLLTRLKATIRRAPSDPAADYRQAIEGMREKASHRGSFKTCEERTAAFAELDGADALLDKLFPAEGA